MTSSEKSYPVLKAIEKAGVVSLPRGITCCETSPRCFEDIHDLFVCRQILMNAIQQNIGGRLCPAREKSDNKVEKKRHDDGPAHIDGCCHVACEALDFCREDEFNEHESEHTATPCDERGNRTTPAKREQH